MKTHDLKLNIEFCDAVPSGENTQNTRYQEHIPSYVVLGIREE